MNFATTLFVLFFLPVLCIGWVLRPYAKAYRLFLIGAGLVFYGQLGAEYLLLLLGVSTLNWGCVRLLSGCHSERKRKMLVAIDVAAHILLLAFFKYAETFFLVLSEFLSTSNPIRDHLLHSGINDILLPAGLSFYSFQGISYVVDHYREPQRPARSFTDVLAYISFFPTVMAGPIMREHEFFPQLNRQPRDRTAFNEGMTYILSGLFKKVVLATYLAEQIVDPLFQTPEDYSGATALMGIYAYTAQIYCDFSGYTDLATGIGRLMGFRLPCNFDSPYRSLNMQEFWRRWHISLSRWLRDYLYIPMGGNRRGNRYLNLIITMLIGGLWHGNGLNFLIWGGCHGVGMAVVHACQKIKARFYSLHTPGTGMTIGITKVAAWLLTFHFTAFLWVFFRAETLQQVGGVLGRLGSRNGEANYPLQIPLIIILVLLLQWYGPACFRHYAALQAKLPWYIRAIVVGMLGGLILNLGPEGMLPFIYFSF